MCIFLLEWPLQVVNASEGTSGDKFKKQLETAAEIVKTAYWSANIVITVQLLVYTCTNYDILLV